MFALSGANKSLEIHFRSFAGVMPVLRFTDRSRERRS
jgi:hypothetical protein